MKYLYIQDETAIAAAPKPHMETNPATVRKRRPPTGTHMGLEMMIRGVNKIRPRIVAVTVRPVRRRRMAPETRSVKKPTSWVEFGACPWSLRRNVEAFAEAGLLVLVGLGALCGCCCWVCVWFW